MTFGQKWIGVAAVLVVLLSAMAADAQEMAARVMAASEPTDLYIRRLARLPDSSARGDIEILDVGHHSGTTMLSIVARRIPAGWSVSYACARSPACAPRADHDARHYVLSAGATAEVDRIVAALKSGEEPDGHRPDGTVVGGWLTVKVSAGDVRWEYARMGDWGVTLGRLDRLLKPPTA